MFITLSILSQVALLMFPDILGAFVNISNIEGFSFGTFFASGGIAALILSVALLAGVFGLIGFKLFGRSKR